MGSGKFISLRASERRSSWCQPDPRHLSSRTCGAVAGLWAESAQHQGDDRGAYERSWAVAALLVSGHGPQDPDGSPAGPFGRVPDEVSAEQAMQSARLAALAVMSSVRGVIGDLDQIDAWVTVTGFVQARPGYAQTTAIINSFSQVVIDVFGIRAGQHARTAIGVAALPLNLPVVVAAELHLAPAAKPGRT